jgi:hypothetical protein
MAIKGLVGRRFGARTGYLLTVLGGAAAIGCSSSTAFTEAMGEEGGAHSTPNSTSRAGGQDPGAAAGRTSQTGSGGGVSGGTASTGDAVPPEVVEAKHYPGHGFIVHEWGTDTIVVGSDGSLQRGLHHEEEDLPAFVYDRLKAAPASPPSVTIKMETPVTYFYSDVPLSVQARVTFPKGLLTQWYPAAKKFLPQIAAPGSALTGAPLTYADPVLDTTFPFNSQLCRDQFSAIAGGELDWGAVSVLARNTDVAAKLTDAPLSKFGWSYARDVDANPVQAPNGETERFLFYRGLGDFDLPVKVQAGAQGHVALTNGYSEPVGRVFVLNVGAERGAFTERRAGIAPGATLDDLAPSLDAAPSLDDYETELGGAVTRALDATGLYHDEATAMVNTWKRQWFRTPGVRVLYLIPQSWTDASIPLSVTPSPDEMLRVMLIRVEVITPEQEASDVKALKAFDADASQTAHFAALGRFAEPRLRRALGLLPSKSGEAYLTTIKSANTAIASGE